jgi:hypothetical protein
MRNALAEINALQAAGIMGQSAIGGAMSPLMQQTLEQKRLRRARRAALPYSEKVRIVEQMRAAALQIKMVAGATSGRPTSLIASAAH